MRVLTTVTGSPSHARAVLPFARALGAAGHEVVVACAPELAGAFDGEPVTVAAVLPSMAAAAQAAMPRIAALGPDPDPQQVVPLLFAGTHVTEAVRALQELGADAPPDLVLRDGGETSGLLYAEHLGVPHLPAPSGAANVMTAAAMAGELAARRAELGFPPADPDDDRALAPWGRLDCMPPAYSLAADGAPPALAFRQDDEVVRGRALPAWVGDLPAGRPLVLAGLGSALPMMAQRLAEHDGPGRGPVAPDTSPGTRARPAPADPAAALRTLLAAMNALDAEVILSTGGLALPDDVAPAGHVHVTDWVPQPLLLGCVDLFVTHGGYNGIREAVRHGVPMVVAPQFGDQEHNADRITALGLGARVPSPQEVTPGRLTTTAATVLRDPGIRAEARRAQRAMLALPPVDTAAARIAEIVAGATRASSAG